MKLINKFLTALAPVEMVGVITPTLVACNKGTSYEIHYGDSVNCLEPSLENYHSVNDVKKAIKSKIDIHPTHEQVSITTLNQGLATNWLQILYYELIASRTYFKETPGILLTDWVPSTSDISVTLKLDGDPIDISEFAYVLHENPDGDDEVYIDCGAIPPFKSYTYQYCTATE